MLGKIIYARPCEPGQPLESYIVVRAYKNVLSVVPVTTLDSFEAFDIEIGHDEGGWEVLGEKIDDGEVLRTIEYIHQTFIKPGEVQWGGGVAATARETIELLEAAVCERPFYDGELGEEYLDDEDEDEDEARAAGEAAAEEMARRVYVIRCSPEQVEAMLSDLLYAGE